MFDCLTDVDVAHPVNRLQHGLAVTASRWVPPTRTYVPALCFAVWLVVSIALGIAPRSRAVWVLENLPVVVAVISAVWVHRRGLLDDRSWIQITIFMLLHAYGSHYTYAATPLGEWARQSFALARNHYDRAVHFSFGLLMFRPARRFAFRDGARLPHRRELLLTLSVVAAAALGYELLEFLVAIVVAPERGAAFLATQGDEWDAQKDTGLAVLGAILATCGQGWSVAGTAGRTLRS